MNIAKWMDELDEVCDSEFEMQVHDLPDVAFLTAYESGLSPKEFRMRHCSLFAPPNMISGGRI